MGGASRADRYRLLVGESSFRRKPLFCRLVQAHGIASAHLPDEERLQQISAKVLYGLLFL